MKLSSRSFPNMFAYLHGTAESSGLRVAQEQEKLLQLDLVERKAVVPVLSPIPSVALLLFQVPTLCAEPNVYQGNYKVSFCKVASCSHILFYQSNYG